MSTRTFPSFLDVGGGNNNFVGAMQLRLATRADGHNNAPPCVKAVTWFDVVARDLFLAVEANVQMSPQLE